jgi:hypothetical protein
LGFLYSNGRFVSVADDPAVVPQLEGLIDLSNRMQRFFREWAAVEGAQTAGGFVDLFSPLSFMVTLHHAMVGESPEFTAQFSANARLLRQVAGQLVEAVVVEQCGRFSEDNVMRQVQAWQRDPLLRELRSIYRHDQETNPISQEWILATAPALEFS